MKRLIVVHGDQALDSALAMADTRKLTEVVVLGLSPDGETGMELQGNDKRIAALADLGLDAMSLGFSTSNLFGEIESLYGSWAMRQDAYAAADLMESCFRLPLLLDVGARYFSVLSRLVELFDEQRPVVVYMNASNGYWSQLIGVLCDRFNVPLEAIDA